MGRLSPRGEGGGILPANYGGGRKNSGKLEQEFPGRAMASGRSARGTGDGAEAPTLEETADASMPDLLARVCPRHPSVACEARWVDGRPGTRENAAIPHTSR
nr:MAG TPA: hypothetical protein [Caudoviricetes sp.]